MVKQFDRKVRGPGFFRFLLGLVPLALFLFTTVTVAAASQTVSVAWDPSPDTSVVGYIVYMGTSSGDYLITNNVGQSVIATVSGLQPGGTYYFSVAAYTAAGVESALSEEIVYEAPRVNPKLQVSVVADTVTLKFSTISGLTYAVEYKNSLDEPDWKPLTLLTGTDGVVTHSETNSGASTRFYRVGVY